jgi:hypothetical protein
MFDARLVGTDAMHDLAVLQVCRVAVTACRLLKLCTNTLQHRATSRLAVRRSHRCVHTPHRLTRPRSCWCPFAWEPLATSRCVPWGRHTCCR